MPPRGAARISDSQPTCFIVKLVPRQAFLYPKGCLRPRLDAKALHSCRGSRVGCCRRHACHHRSGGCRANTRPL
jgi:hypothetical protein